MVMDTARVQGDMGQQIDIVLPVVNGSACRKPWTRTKMSGCVANLEQGRGDGQRSVTGSGSKQIELLCQ